MIVDDEPDIVDIAQKNLQRNGYEVYKAYNGKDAYDIAVAMTPDVIVTDVTMPEINGYEFCKLLRSNPATKNIPIIVLTAHKHLEDSFLYLSIKDYLVKPFSYDVLKERIQKKLDYVKLMQIQRTKIVIHSSQPWVIKSMANLIAKDPQWLPTYTENAKELCDEASIIGADVVLIDLLVKDKRLEEVFKILRASPSLVNTALLTYYSPISQAQGAILQEAKFIEVQYLKNYIMEYSIKEHFGCFSPEHFLDQINIYRKNNTDENIN